MVPLLQISSQQVSLSQDLVDFGTVPALCTVRRMLVLRNLSATSACEFVVDESSCVLCMDGLLSVQPSYGSVTAIRVYEYPTLISLI